MVEEAVLTCRLKKLFSTVGEEAVITCMVKEALLISMHAIGVLTCRLKKLSSHA
jgi:hypothetical protein